MAWDRLQYALDKRLQNQIVSPVIIKVRHGYLRDVYAEIASNYDLSRYLMRNFFMQEIMPYGLVPGQMLPAFDMLTAWMWREDIYRWAEDRRIEKIYYDAPMYALMDVVPAEGIYKWGKMEFTTTYWTKKIIGADIANQKGFTGKGVKVAIPDTGVALHHEQLGWRVDFETVMPFQRVDGNGHGTWVATCIGGHRAEDWDKSRKLGKRVIVEGMAPDTQIMAIKCLGYGIGTGSTSQVAKAMELALEWGADVVSMSLGGKEEAQNPEDDPYYHILETYLQHNIVPVIAAGNSGPDQYTVGSPGALPQALTVAAWDPIKGEIASFSSRGPTPWNDVKPDVAAPGVNIDSGCVGYLDLILDRREDRYSPLSGTSMATPHVSGLVACMRQAHKQVLGKTLTVNEIKEMMSRWAEDNGIVKDNIQGWGLIKWDIYEWWLETQYGAKI
ncbi:MAG: S8 family serine peptidase [Crenarchaeota archaeon]|nr:S8 family serine peptidase [Thermoproteota archaeon]